MKLCLAREMRVEGNDSTTCPVCNEPIIGSPDELNEHVEYCLSRVGRHFSEQACCTVSCWSVERVITVSV